MVNAKDARENQEVESARLAIYQDRINRVVDFINNHLDEKLSLANIAEVACLSAFHFHRIFSALTGETLSDFVRRLRLERSAGMLMKPSCMTIMEIALQNGFSSPAIFTRAFRDWFGTSPTAFREAFGENSKKSKINSKKSKAGLPGKRYALHVLEKKTVARLQRHPVRVERLPDLDVAYVRYVGDYGPAIAAAWHKLKRWVLSVMEEKDTRWMGVIYDNPGITEKTKCRYDACAVLPADLKKNGQLGRGIGRIKIHGALYAQYTLDTIKPVGDIIGKAYQYLYGHWLPESGYEPDDLPGIQMVEFEPHGRAIRRMVIGIPVKPL